MGSQDTNAVPVSLVLVDNGKNLTFSGTLVLSASNVTEVKPTEIPYDAKGAGLFTVVVISVYCISIVLFIASFIKRKKGITVEAEENNTVTQYLTQVPDLKEKTAREHFRKLKMGIIEKVEKGVENDKFSNRFKDKRMKGPAEIRQPLLENECTNCVGSRPPNNLETCAKLVQALHSIKEVEEVTDYSKSSSEPYTPPTSSSYDPLGSSSATTQPTCSSPITPGYPPDKYYKFFTFVKQSSVETGSSVSQDINWEDVWLGSPGQNKMNSIEKSNDSAKTCNVSEEPLVALPPPPAFQQGYHNDTFQNNFKPKTSFPNTDSYEDSFKIQTPPDLTGKFDEPIVQIHGGGMNSTNQHEDHLDSRSVSVVAKDI